MTSFVAAPEAGRQLDAPLRLMRRAAFAPGPAARAGNGCMSAMAAITAIANAVFLLTETALLTKCLLLRLV
jgi:hypothetical protein